MSEMEMIKPEFVITDHERVLSLDCVSDADKNKLAQGDAAPKDDDTSKNGQEESVEETKNGGGKRKKLKGQNKNRALFKLRDEKQLCSRILFEDDPLNPLKEPCRRCRFLHKVEDYLKVKDPDLGSTCHVYDVKGKCKWGVACRFGSAHLEKNGRNKENPEQMATFAEDKSLHTVNRVDSSDLVKLRKRKYDFSQTMKVIKEVDKVFSREDSKVKPGEKRSLEEDEEDQCCGSKKSKNEQHRKLAANWIAKDRQNLESGGISIAKDMVDNAASEWEKEYDPESAEIECDSLKEAADVDNAASESQKEYYDLESAEIECDSLKEAADAVKTCGPLDDTDLIKLRPTEKKQIDWKDKLYLAPLTTVGNLPFRRICKEYGADVTCSEMVLARSLLRGDQREWSLIKRHGSEDLYGIQIAANNPFLLARASQALNEMCQVDFIDINLGCPIDELYRQGVGSGMLMRPRLLKYTATALDTLLDIPYTYKMRMGCKKPMVLGYMPWLKKSGLSLITIHGRTREQRYTRMADWDYVEKCAEQVSPIPVFGNGDVLSYQDYQKCMDDHPNVAGVMIARGALMKPWIFQEIKEKRIMDPTSSERLDMLKKYVNYGLENWGSDSRGVENTRRFLLEWLSFLHRYVPTGLLVNPPQVMNQRPPFYRGRDEIETLMASPNAQDWIKISELLLGPIPDGFVFLPKHKANAWK